MVFNSSSLKYVGKDAVNALGEVVALRARAQLIHGDHDIALVKLSNRGRVNLRC